MSKRRSFTLRLSEADEKALDTLSQQLEADRSTTVRQALRIALQKQPTISASGVFTPVNTPHASLTVILKGNAHE